MPILIFGSPDSGVSVGVTPAIGSGSALAPVGRQRVFTNTGQIAAGALLRTYMAGAASTPLQTYADEQLSIENPNPIEASASGLFGPIYLIEGQAYYFVLTEADGTPIWEQDNVGDDVQVPAAVAAVTTVVPQSSVLVGTQHDFPLTPGATQLRLDNASLLRITGFSAGVAGQRLTVISVGAGQVDFAHENAGSVAANRLHNFATSGDTSLASAVGTAVFEYDASNARWRMVEHNQGAWITVAFAAGNFSATGGGTWTVGAADVSTLAYFLRDRTLTVNWQVSSTSVAGVVSSLNILNAAFAGFVAAKTMYGFFLYNDNGAGNAVGYTSVSAADTKVVLSKLAGNFSVAADATHTFGAITFEVQ